MRSLLLVLSVALWTRPLQALTQYDGSMLLWTAVGNVIGEMQVELDPLRGAIGGRLSVCCPDPRLIGDYRLKGGLKAKGLTLRDRKHGVAILIDPHTLHGTITFQKRSGRRWPVGTSS